MNPKRRTKWIWGASILIGLIGIGAVFVGRELVAQQLPLLQQATSFSNAVMEALRQEDAQKLAELVPARGERERLIQYWRYLVSQFGAPKTVRLKRISLKFGQEAQAPPDTIRRIAVSYDVGFVKKAPVAVELKLSYNGRQFRLYRVEAFRYWLDMSLPLVRVRGDEPIERWGVGTSKD